MSDFNSSYNYTSQEEFFKLVLSSIDSIDHSALYEQIKYQGFNREDFLKSALKHMSPATMIRVAMIGAVRGSNFKKISDTPNLPQDVKSLMDSGIIINAKPKKTSDITLTRCTAAMPQWTAYSLLKADVPGRIGKSNLHACLQFPAAGSLPMSLAVRTAHIEFSAQFSILINGSFKASIYKAMYSDTVDVASIHPEVLVHLSVTKNSDAVVDIDRLLAEHVDEEEMDVDDAPVFKGKRKRSKR
jgi:hypothetical protein